MRVGSKMFYLAKGYIQLSERKFNMQSFFGFCFLLFISGILNFFSPSDGKANNMFSAIVNKNRKIVDLPSVDKAFPFRVFITNITVHGLNRIKANVTLSHTGKLACILADANYTNEELDYLDEDTNRFYFRSNISRIQTFRVNTTIGKPQRLFCNATTLIPNVRVSTFYKSPPFYFRCTFS